MALKDYPERLQLTELVGAMAKSVPPLAAMSTVAIVATKALVTRQLGSGTLLAVAGSCFLLTAAHVAREGGNNGYTLGMSGSKTGKFIALGGIWMVTPGSGQSSADDRYDVALYQLSKEQIGKLEDASFVRLGDASFRRDLSTGYFVVTGYPGMWSTVLDGADVAMRSKLLQYGTWAYSGSTAALENFEEDHHFLLTVGTSNVHDAAGEAVSFRTRQGYAANIPKDLQGISGCSVWMIGDLSDPVETWNPKHSRIVGVQTGVFPSRSAIKVTRWNAVTTLLYKAYPELRSTIEMYASQELGGV